MTHVDILDKSPSHPDAIKRNTLSAADPGQLLIFAAMEVIAAQTGK